MLPSVQWLRTTGLNQVLIQNEDCLEKEILLAYAVNKTKSLLKHLEC